MTELVLQSQIPPLKEIWHRVKIQGDETYRYQLELIWDPSRPPMGYIGLNPSTASLEEPDQTCRKFFLYATRENAGGFIVGNLAAYRAKKPSVLRTVKDPVGGYNFDAIVRIVKRSSPVIVCWGADPFAKEFGRGDRLVSELYVLLGRSMHCLGTTKDGSPQHPLYLPGNQAIVPYVGRA